MSTEVLNLVFENVFGKNSDLFKQPLSRPSEKNDSFNRSVNSGHDPNMAKTFYSNNSKTNSVRIRKDSESSQKDYYLTFGKTNL